MSMGRGAWERTPYAKTDAKNPDSAVNKLLDKYLIRQRQWTEDIGPNGRLRLTLQFIGDGKTYRIGLEVLDVTGVDEDQLARQIKRVIFWTLKPLLENAVVFGNKGREKLLLPFLVDNTGHTVYDQIAPHLTNINARSLLEVGRKLALPAPE